MKPLLPCSWSLRLLGVALCLIVFTSPCLAGLKLYYLRHAEGGHNVVKDWKDKPKSEWPDYVGNPDVFTPKGKEQAAAVPAKLQKYPFDVIICSPLWRTRNTVLPHLKAAKRQAEIWPELEEFRGGLKILATNLPAPAQGILNAGPAVTFPAEEAPFFTLRPDATHRVQFADRPADEHEADTQFLVRQAAAMIRQKFGGTDKSVLLVGHGAAGKALLKTLLNDSLDEFPHMANTGIWMIEEQPNGRWKPRLFNDQPWPRSQKSGPRKKASDR